MTVHLTDSATHATIAGASIAISGPMTELMSCDSAGTCFIAGYAGTYSLAITAPGYEALQRSVTVPAVHTARCSCPSTVPQSVNVQMAPVLVGRIDVPLPTPSWLGMAVGTSEQFHIVAYDRQGQVITAFPRPTWSVNDTTFASVDSTGRVTGKSAGQIVLTATIIQGNWWIAGSATFSIVALAGR